MPSRRQIGRVLACSEKYLATLGKKNNFGIVNLTAEGRNETA
jgi:hypothetical protein